MKWDMCSLLNNSPFSSAGLVLLVLSSDRPHFRAAVHPEMVGVRRHARYRWCPIGWFFCLSFDGRRQAAVELVLRGSLFPGMVGGRRGYSWYFMVSVPSNGQKEAEEEMISHRTLYLEMMESKSR